MQVRWRVAVGLGVAVREEARFGVGTGVRVGIRVAVGVAVGVVVGVSVGVGVDVGVAVGGAATVKAVSPQSYGVAKRYSPCIKPGNCTVAPVAPRASVGPNRNSPAVCPVSVAYTAQTKRFTPYAWKFRGVSTPGVTEGPTVMKEVEGCSRI